MSDNNQTNTSNDDLNKGSNKAAQSSNQNDKNDGSNNPQKGDDWDNYRTRELSGNSDSNTESASDAAEAFKNDK